MRWIPGVLCTAVLAVTTGACAALSGLSAYTSTDCPGGCDASVDSSASADGATTADAATDAIGIGSDSAGPTDGGDGGAIGPGGCSGGLVACDGGCVDGTTVFNCGSCGTACAGGTPICLPVDGVYSCVATCPAGAPTCPRSTGTSFSCALGGCNTASASCSAAGQSCFCSKDSHCKSGKCVKTTGQNDSSCGANCTGSGPADGFGCQLVANGIPASCTFGFGYTPSNFAAAMYTPPAGATANCNATYSSTTHTFTAGACTGTAPAIQSGVVQAGGPNADILIFSSLTIASGSTLTLAGSSPVILAVYGDATIAGNIVADGAAGGIASGPNPATSGPGGNWQCSTSVGGTGPSGHNTGGGGGGGAGAGGAGGNDTASNPGGSAGASRVNPSIVPLYGGCPGGASGDYGAQAGKSPTYPGGGGGAVQISAAGTLSVSGTISAQGGMGASGTLIVGSNHYAGGAGGGSGGAVLLEGSRVSAGPSTTVVNGGPGGASGVTPNINPGGVAGNSGAPNGGNGTSAPGGNPINSGGGGGGGGYGYLRVNSGLTAPRYACLTTLSPLPVCNATHTACLCAADSDCSSGKCVNASGQCSGACTGSGTADSANCVSLTSVATAWACSVGNCDSVTSPMGTCGAAGIACFCTSDAQCSGSKCVSWAGCASAACTGSGTPSGFHCSQ